MRFECICRNVYTLNFVSIACKHGMFLQPVVEKKQPDTLPIGLVGRENAITRDQERQLLAYIDTQPWNCELKRRTQHYGYKYSYVGKPLEKVQPIEKLFLDVLGSTEDIKALFDGEIPNQVIVNEYIPGQGISRHIDDTRQFGPVIASLSLNSGIEMQIQRNCEIVTKYLQPRSLYCLKGDARYKWTHAIIPRKTDTVDGKRVARNRRVSVTYRTVREGTSAKPRVDGPSLFSDSDDE
jgi:alkylated DNA repair dioxygenase AlkB